MCSVCSVCTLSTRMVGTLPSACTSTDLQLTTSIDETTSEQTMLTLSQSSWGTRNIAANMSAEIGWS